MFGWFTRKPVKRFAFDSNQAAFDYACLYQDYPILLEALIPALVVERGKLDPDGTRHFLLRLPSREGGREIWSCTLKESADYPDIGELVGFRVVTIAPNLPPEASIIGYIAAKLAPEFVEKKGWRIVKSYTPQNIKQTVRW